MARFVAGDFEPAIHDAPVSGEAGRRLFDLGDLGDGDVAEAMFALQRQKTGNDFLPHYLQQIVAISVVLVSKEQLKVWSLGEKESPEEELIQRFYDGLSRYSPM